MERIAKLLFATTFLSIFCYLIVFSFVDFSGNGGEYWGYDGHIEPFIAAERAFKTGDSRFLGFDLVKPLGSRVKDIPIFSACDNHPFGAENFYRMNIIEAKHGADSIRKASAFAHRFNDTMASILESERQFKCVKYIHE